MNRCPCCGQAIERRFEWDYPRGVLAIDGRLIKLTPRQADLFEVLVRRAPRMVGFGALIAAMYGADEPSQAHRLVCIHAYDLRCKLKGTRLAIASERGRGARGYALTGVP